MAKKVQNSHQRINTLLAIHDAGTQRARDVRRAMLNNTQSPEARVLYGVDPTADGVPVEASMGITNLTGRPHGDPTGTTGRNALEYLPQASPKEHEELLREAKEHRAAQAQQVRQQNAQHSRQQREQSTLFAKRDARTYELNRRAARKLALKRKATLKQGAQQTQSHRYSTPRPR